MDITRAITSHVKSASFSFLTADEVRSISVRQVVNPVLLDNANAPTEGGLYDPAFGPMRLDDICQTCHMNHFECPGHFGHIELPAPVFHPLFMNHAYSLLRGTCVFCHHFKISKMALAKYTAQFRLLEYGMVEEARAIALEQLRRSEVSADADDEEGDDDDDVPLASIQTQQAAETVAEFVQRMTSTVNQLIAKAERRGIRRGSDHGMATYSARRDLRNVFLKDILRRRCERCQAMNPTLRKDGFVKITERVLSARDQAIHEARGIRRDNVLLDRADTKPGSKESDEAMAVDDHAEATIETPSITLKEARKLSKDAGDQTRVVPASECRANLRRLFKNESEICSLIFGRHPVFGGQAAPSADVFFVEVICVTPTRFRPASVMGDQTFENAQNELLTKVLQTTFLVRDCNERAQAFQRKSNYPVLDGVDESEAIALQKQWETDRRTAMDQLLSAMMQLQVSVNCYMDSSKNPAPQRQGSAAPPGVKQGLEKKEGLFRKHMMGKRVNFAARSVISPDVNIETNEIGVPPVFAKRLTYPEPVTVHNYELMRQLVINGPDVYPGAHAVRAEDGTETLLKSLSVEERTALANQLLTPQGQTSRQARGTFGGVGGTLRTPVANKQVLRHLRTGDILVMNRQPTLHKPSMMAHRARVLTGERTIRMHYANCNSYNADFDGDEMNMHFPQSQMARAECYNIANTDNQYLVPTSGNPLRGLIQDHVVAGVWMTCKNTLYTREEYQQFLFNALRPETYNQSGRIKTLPPAIYKPVPRWTGKQVISTILLNVTPSHAQGLNFDAKAKVGAKFWGAAHKDEETVVVRDGELLTGVLDKSQIGASAYGLVHAVYEIYGSESAGRLLSILSRLFTMWLQHNAFSCRMDDLLLSAEGDAERRRLLKEGAHHGLEAAMGNVGLGEENPKKAETQHNLRLRLEEVLRDDEKLAALDAAMMGASNKLTSSVIASCIPSGLWRVFPENNMQMMTVSGAKGSAVNVSSISCLLGPQALEGRRVPVMVSGKTLPSFKAFETEARAGGFVAGRFLTGIAPQEYYFHCMAGREGLIDTAVKTSRSGYLQRCLIKHLEGVSVQYDQTVRNSDGFVLQFHYGEDALDVTKSKYLDRFDFTVQNFESYRRRYNPVQLESAMEVESAPDHMKRALKKPHKYAPVLSVYNPARHFGSMSESFAQKVEEYVAKNPRGLLARKKKDTTPEGVPMKLARPKLNAEQFRAMTKVLYHRGLVEPGENVGLLAAQGVGEPSTQMTLNTFHFAGHGAANVTLGIPRLREIVMTASKDIKTPIMRLPVREGVTEDQMRTFCKDGSRLVLSQIVEEATVTERMMPKTAANGYQRQKQYTVRLQFYPADEVLEEYNASTEHVLQGLEATFVPLVEREIVRELKRLRRDQVRQSQSIGQGETFNDTPAQADQDDEAPSTRARPEDDSDDEDRMSEAGDDDDATAAKRRANAGSKVSYDEAEAEDREADTADEIARAFQDEAEEAPEDEDQEPANMETRVSDLDERLQNESKFVSAFRFDSVHGEWAEFDLQMHNSTEKMLLINVIERVCRASVVHEIPRISRMMIPPPAPGETEVALTAEGINLPGLWDFGFGVIDLDRIYSNDIGALLSCYGVEAARAAIVSELKGIFDTYGIGVSMRHLYLIADYQTAFGDFRPFSRGGLADAPSPLLKASFEMTMAFLSGAALFQESDNLSTPSSNLVIGRPVTTGTGATTIHMPLVATA
ncbi:DNA-directed 5'-3' RNA polymerase [Malassezia pachydermatis]|uniref:DNA-directed RNA polymerase subunit n=1 Tax=Malassezia pachydermatis TaxID=77020 RepID=A0A0M9VMN2_9BASI|nr:beta and beta-prime subunits of dna dependent rna-polymerase [Malassezia pachydermatis]KOS12439.1 beta and beta-prime subunits of dna dependent rna-polymerase [Malassezia pachydermatis]